MVNIPMRFKRVAAAFDEVATRVRSCDESSGSEHSADLSDLVNSFFEREIREQRENEEEEEGVIEINEINEGDDDESNGELASQDSLKKMFDYGKDKFRLNIHAEVEKALGEVGGNSSLPDFNRQLMARLRDRGFDAGLCKTKWVKNGRRPPGDYEYTDVNRSGTRYIIEVSLAVHFTIARPTPSYATLLEILPLVYVGKPDELKKMVRLMCNAIRKSMKGIDMHVTPWRRMAYMQAKWFESYKRTTNEISTRKETIFGVGFVENRHSVGFAPVKGIISFNCRKDYGSKGGVRVGNLAMALKQEEMVS